MGSSLADVEPMTVDRSISFSSVGGLSSHVRSLREMVVLPLLYPEIFDKFGVTPPRGVLFYGPPGNASLALLPFVIYYSIHDYYKLHNFS